MTPPKRCTRASRQAEHTLYPQVIADLAARRATFRPDELARAHPPGRGDADDQLGGVLADLVTMNTARPCRRACARGSPCTTPSTPSATRTPPSARATGGSCGGVGLRPAAAAIAVDMLYDHLLARRWASALPGSSLETFAEIFTGRAARETFIPPGARRRST